MQKNTDNRDCIAVIGSVTGAMRARSVLRGAGIDCEVIKAESTQSNRGCTYGVTYPCLWEGKIRQLLQNAGIIAHSFERSGRL